MYLKGLSLRKFRNISDLSLVFHPRFNVFVGPNAQGKTNIIEAIYFLAFGRSFRSTDYRGLIQWREAQAQIRSWANSSLGEEERTAHLNLDKKRILKNGKTCSPNQFESMPTVLFAPEEILLLKDSPQARRDYVDGLLSKLSPTYNSQLQDYKRALTQRNKLLKNEFISNEEKQKQMTVWEGPLIEHGKHLIEERMSWTGRLSEVLKSHYKTIAGDNKNASFSYKPNVTTSDFLACQEIRRKEEIERGISLVGPHRDDFLACLDSWPISSFGSQGEMRSFTLALKLSEIQLFEEILNQSPLLLLDDVLSELDENRSRFFFSFLETFRGQVFATATSLNLFPKSSRKDFLSWQIEGGKAR